METDVIFGGFEHLYKKTLEIEDQLLCQDVQAIAGDSYDNLRRTFESFQKTLRRVALEAKHKNVQNMQQLTMHDMFKHQWTLEMTLNTFTVVNAFVVLLVSCDII